jgi:hypothetical protein
LRESNDPAKHLFTPCVVLENASLTGNVKLAKYLLETENVNSCLDKSIEIAIREGHTKMMDVFDIPESHSEHYLSKAVAADKPGLIAYFLDRTDVDSACGFIEHVKSVAAAEVFLKNSGIQDCMRYRDCNPLRSMVAHGKPEVIKFMLEQSPVREPANILHLAVPNPSVLKMLLSTHYPNRLWKDRSPLDMAIEGNHIESIRLLLGHKDLNNYRIKDLFIKAAKEKDTETMKLVLDKNPNLTTSEAGFVPLFSSLEISALIREKINKGDKPMLEAQGCNSILTSFHWFIQHGNGRQFWPQAKDLYVRCRDEEINKKYPEASRNWEQYIGSLNERAEARKTEWAL